MIAVTSKYKLPKKIIYRYKMKFLWNDLAVVSVKRPDIEYGMVEHEVYAQISINLSVSVCPANYNTLSEPDESFLRSIC